MRDWPSYPPGTPRSRYRAAIDYGFEGIRRLGLVEIALCPQSGRRKTGRMEQPPSLLITGRVAKTALSLVGQKRFAPHRADALP